MNLRSLQFILFLLVVKGALLAQVTQVSVGPGYSQQAYYSLSTGEVVLIENEAWDIAFSSQGVQDAGILINESAGSGAEGLSLFVSEISDWSETIVDEGQFADSLKLYNTEASWTEGAFNSIRDTSSAFDYGWGAYNPATNTLEGSKIFVIKLRDGALKKLQVMNLTAGTYNFRYANLDGSDETTKAVSKESDSGAAIKLFSFKSGEEVDLPMNFDLVFQRYITDLDVGDGTSIPYTVTGVLSGPGVEVAKADGVNPETVEESNYTELYETDLKTIGHDWKSFDFMQGWLIDEDLAYFVKTSDGSKHKIVFFDFEGSSTGNITFGKTDLLTSSTENSRLSQENILIYPNPFTYQITIHANEPSETFLQVFDLTGRLLETDKFEGEKRIQLGHLDAGKYLVRLSNAEETVSRIVLKQ